jgi:hydroxypyruvate isomerase
MIWSAHISMLFNEHPYVERVQRARAAGFACVDTWWPAPDDADGLVAGVTEHGVRVAAINAYGGDLAAGDRGFLNDPSRRTETTRWFLDALDLAERLGTTMVHVLVGRALPGIPESAQRSEVASALRDCAALAHDRGITILVEALNEHDVPGYLLPTPEAAARLIDAVGSDSVRLLLDAYHVDRAGGDPVDAALGFADVIGHVHVADWPGRGPPGSGALDLWTLVERLHAVGYGGAIALEYDPRGDTPASLAFLRSAPPCAPFRPPGSG